MTKESTFFTVTSLTRRKTSLERRQHRLPLRRFTIQLSTKWLKISKLAKAWKSNKLLNIYFEKTLTGSSLQVCDKNFSANLMMLQNSKSQWYKQYLANNTASVQISDNRVEVGCQTLQILDSVWNLDGHCLSLDRFGFNTLFLML